MQTHFSLFDNLIVVGYLAAMVFLGTRFKAKSSTPSGFMIAQGKLPSWAVGLSILGAFVSSITFLAYPGQAFNFNWDAFLFSLTLPMAALVATIYFIPLYRTRVKVSAFEYMEQRFGGWARVYSSVSFMFGESTRVGMILYLLSLPLHDITGWPYVAIIVVAGMTVIFYTMIGGIEAVVWTDVVQVIILFGGAFAAVFFVFAQMPEGPRQVFAIAAEHDKFSLGRWDLSLVYPTAWVVVLYGIMENLRNFGVDQNNVQRYHTTRTIRDASRSLWTAALGYIPISALFLFIGTCMFAYYTVYRNQLPPELRAQDMGDKIFPYFIATQLPAGVRGLLIAAIFAAAQSTIASSLNCLSTLTYYDFYRKYFRRDTDDQQSMKMLRCYTVIWGVIGTLTGLALAFSGIPRALETGWQLGGIAGGGVIGLFLLGVMFSHIKKWHAMVAVCASVASIAWATFARDLPADWQWLECTWNNRMIGVIGTVTLLVVGVVLGLFSWRRTST
ncbi:MAG: sodium:solute symporter [Planctomycetes bacterium RBG_16_64_10]|nr:MAG: sodium:solute symporter [Planctomycetes bacterium RBG_16_64_10]